MAKIKIELKDEHIKLIQNFKFNLVKDTDIVLDTYSPYGGDFLMEDLAMILGHFDKSVPHTELDYDGKKFGLELETEMWSYHIYIMDNIEYIISIVLQYLNDGVKPGVYTAITNILEWKYTESK